MSNWQTEAEKIFQVYESRIASWRKIAEVLLEEASCKKDPNAPEYIPRAVVEYGGLHVSFWSLGGYVALWLARISLRVVVVLRCTSSALVVVWHRSFVRVVFLLRIGLGALRSDPDMWDSSFCVLHAGASTLTDLVTELAPLNQEQRQDVLREMVMPFVAEVSVNAVTETSLACSLGLGLHCDVFSLSLYMCVCVCIRQHISLSLCVCACVCLPLHGNTAIYLCVCVLPAGMSRR